MPLFEVLFAIAAVIVAFFVFFKPSSSHRRPGSPKGAGFKAIADSYRSLEEVQRALREAGLESSNLILGIDFTASNEWTGSRTFGGKSLHYVNPADPGAVNPYQRALSIVARTLAAFDDDGLIPAFGFGDSTTKDRAVFAFHRDRPCRGLDEVLLRYAELLPRIKLSGPTSFAPVIRKAIEIVRETGEYHILVIVADGQVTNERESVEAIVEASSYALSIVVIGVGDGPWDMMEDFDDRLPQRKFDNFQFVDFHRTMVERDGREPDFALAALMEIPEQYKAIRQLGLLGKR